MDPQSAVVKHLSSKSVVDRRGSHEISIPVPVQGTDNKAYENSVSKTQQVNAVINANELLYILLQTKITRIAVGQLLHVYFIFKRIVARKNELKNRINAKAVLKHDLHKRVRKGPITVHGKAKTLTGLQGFGS